MSEPSFDERLDEFTKDLREQGVLLAEVGTELQVAKEDFARLVSERDALRERCEALEAFESVSVALQSLVAELRQERDQLREALGIAAEALKEGDGAVALGALSVAQHALAAEHQEP